MFLLKYVKNIKSFLLILLFVTSNAYLVFPVNTLLEKNFQDINNSVNFTSEDLLNYYLPNEMFTYIYMGTPKTKLYTLLDFENYQSFTDNSVCNLPSIIMIHHLLFHQSQIIILLSLIFLKCV